MKRIALILFFVCIFYSHSFAVGEGVLIAAQTMMQEAWEGVRNSQAVSMILQLKQTYEQSQEYYDYVKKINDTYKGGVGQYYADSIKKSLESQLNNQWQTIRNDKGDKSNYFVSLNDKLKEEEKKLQSRLEYYKKQKTIEDERTAKKNKMIEEYLGLAKKNALNKEEKERMQGLHEAVQILQTEEQLAYTKELNDRDREKDIQNTEKKQNIIDQWKIEAELNKRHYELEETRTNRDYRKASEIFINHKFVENGE